MRCQTFEVSKPEVPGTFLIMRNVSNRSQPVFRRIALLLCLCFVATDPVLAQIPLSPTPGQTAPSPREIKRYEIEAKRMGVDPDSEDALPRSREFLRIDSTYYVGWYYEGTYKYNHAADYLGYRNASVPLDRALSLMERDFAKQLRTRTSDLASYFQVYRYHIDYTHIAYLLMNCYSNMEEPQKVYDLLRRVLRWNFQRDFYMDAYNYLGWTVHRNRFFTKDQYSFLGNSVADNEALALRYLDSGLRKIERDRLVNREIFPPGYERNDKLAVYHYKAMLYSYALNIDSAARYYRLMRNSPVFSHNNYATFRAICGDFRTAEAEYQLAGLQETGDKRLREYIYYTSILHIYKGQPDRGAALLKDMIRANGSTPGFGWYNIALARCMYYDGQIMESRRYADKAAQFRELHIGTTLGQSHYDFSLQLNRLMTKEAEWEMLRFENRNWWYNPVVLAKMARTLGEKYLQQFLIINQFAQNPERDRVIYKLFSTESTVGWDEIWYLIKDFSTGFFIERFSKELARDERPLIRKYYRLFLARLQMMQGNYREARQQLNEILERGDTDPDYEKLFIARAFEAQALCAQKLKDEQARNEWLYRLYLLYPQLVPASGMKMNMQLHVSGKEDPKVTARLKACNINWVTGRNVPAAHAYLIFSEEEGRKNITYYVLDAEGNEVVAKQRFRWQDPEAAGLSLAYRLFRAGNRSAAETAQ
jgi:Tfp pilus assembly protein PilF